jgi:hypothetical protein
VVDPRPSVAGFLSAKRLRDELGEEASKNGSGLTDVRRWPSTKAMVQWASAPA